MTRNLTAGMQAGIAASVVRPVFFYEAEFTGTLYLWSHLGTISWNSHTWTGIGDLLTISPVDETSELKAAGLALRLSGIDQTFLDLAIGGLHHGKSGRIYLGLLDDNGGLIDSPRIFFRGKLDSVEIDYKEPMAPVINFNYETELIDLERSRNWRYTDAHQQLRYPGDTSLRHVESLQDRQLSWFARVSSQFI